MHTLQEVIVAGLRGLTNPPRMVGGNRAPTSNALRDYQTRSRLVESLINEVYRCASEKELVALANRWSQQRDNTLYASAAEVITREPFAKD